MVDDMIAVGTITQNNRKKMIQIIVGVTDAAVSVRAARAFAERG